MCNDSSYFTGKLFHVNGQSYFFNTIPGTINEIAYNMAPILNDLLNSHGGCDIPRSGSYTGDLRPVIRNPYSTAEIKETLNHKLRLLVLELTTSCNMNCDYCINGASYEQKDCFTSTQMSKQSAFDGVDYLINHSQNQSKPLAISFYGGEPLLRFSLLKEITIYAEKEASKKGKEMLFSITTNGTLLTGEMIEFFIQHSFQMVISLDGPAEINDSNRKLKNGEGTFDRIMDVLQMIKKRDAAYFNHMVRCSVVVMPNADLIELATFFNELHINIIANFVETYGLDDSRFRQKASNNSMESLQNSLIERLSKEGTSILSNSSSGKDFSIALFSTMLRRFLESKTSSRFMELGQCIPGASRLYLAADNFFYPCEKLAGHSIARIGNIETGIDPIKAENLIKQFYGMASSKCSGCWMSSRCSACLALTCSGDGLDENKFNHYCNGIKSWGLTDLKMISKTMFPKSV